MRREHAFAHGIERLGLSADAVLERLGNIGREGEWVEAFRVIVSGIISHTEMCASLFRKDYVEAAR